eukprot:353273-Chlamydomonas_euryale.AAC.7
MKRVAILWAAFAVLAFAGCAHVLNEKKAHLEVREPRHVAPPAVGLTQTSGVLLFNFLRPGCVARAHDSVKAV